METLEFSEKSFLIIDGFSVLSCSDMHSKTGSNHCSQCSNWSNSDIQEGAVSC